MEYVRVSGIDREASRIGLGTWSIGGWMWGGTDTQASLQTIRVALERGINLIDTAPAYGWGLAEELVGKAIVEYGQRDRVIIATKAGLELRNGQVYRNSTKELVLREVEDSLRRLRTDYIDIYQVHWPDPLVPITETAEVMHQLFQQGKIRAIGVSNYSPEQMMLFRQVAPLHTSQPPYNLFERGIGGDVLSYCRSHGITTLTYGPLCRGLLSGRMRPDTQFQGDDLRQVDPKFLPPRYAEYLKAVQLLDQFAQENYDRRVIHLAVRWLLDQPGVSVALWGARRPEQLDPVDDVLGWSVDAAAHAAIDRIIRETITDPGPDFVGPLTRSA